MRSVFRLDTARNESGRIGDVSEIGEIEWTRANSLAILGAVEEECVRRIIPSLLLVMLGAGLPGVSPGDLGRIIDFEGSIKSLSELVRLGADRQIDRERYFVLDGWVASTRVLDRNPASFSAIVEIVCSEWVGLERIEVHRVYVRVAGPEHADRIPERLPENPGPRIIRPYQRILVIGPYIGTAIPENGEPVPVVRAIELR